MFLWENRKIYIVFVIKGVKMKSFQDEKMFYRDNKPDCGQAWEGIFTQDVFYGWEPVDPDIYSFLVLLNTFPFMYSAGMSCSGSLKDHKGFLVANNGRFGIDVEAPQGYCVIRVDKSQEGWEKFKRLLTRVPHSKLTSSLNWVREDCRYLNQFPASDYRDLVSYQIFTGDGKVRGDVVANVWRDLTYGLVDMIQSINLND